MQQVRDARTDYRIESTLGFDAGPSTPLQPSHRRALYNALKRCRTELDRLRPPQARSITAVNDLLTLSFPQAGQVPASGAKRYAVRLLQHRESRFAWSPIANMPRSKVLKIETDVPLAPYRQGGEDPVRKLAKAVQTAFTSNGKPRLRLSHTRDSRNEENLYVLDEHLVALKLAEHRSQPAFAALAPLGTIPYAKSEAAIWDWPNRKTPPTDDSPATDWSTVQIRAFDQDTAFEELLRDIDLALAPAEADTLWSESDETRRLLDELLTAKEAVAKEASRRRLSILDSRDEEAELAAAADPLVENLRNSFRKRLGRAADIDTILVVPLRYAPIAEDGSFLLYGKIEAPGNAHTAAHFLPAALRRDGSGNSLIVQFDARQPAARENFVGPLTFTINHVRWDVDGDDTPYGVKWLNLFEPAEVPLSADSNGRQSAVDIPVLLKRLLEKPDVAVAAPVTGHVAEGDTFAEAMNKVRHWQYRFDVERTHTATQDDLLVDIEYNVEPPDVAVILPPLRHPSRYRRRALRVRAAARRPAPPEPARPLVRRPRPIGPTWSQPVWRKLPISSVPARNRPPERTSSAFTNAPGPRLLRSCSRNVASGTTPTSSSSWRQSRRAAPTLERGASDAGSVATSSTRCPSPGRIWMLGQASITLAGGSKSGVWTSCATGMPGRRCRYSAMPRSARSPMSATLSCIAPT